MSQQLFHQWLKAKADEAAAIQARREIEDKISGLFDLSPALDGTQTHKDGQYIVKVTGRINRKVNGDKLQEVAAEHGLSDHLTSLFRWKPEINMAAWKAAAPAITGPLADAITSTPGRPSFTITIQE
jgi:hypothetical protein